MLIVFEDIITEYGLQRLYDALDNNPLFQNREIKFPAGEDFGFDKNQTPLTIKRDSDYDQLEEGARAYVKTLNVQLSLDEKIVIKWLSLVSEEKLKKYIFPNNGHVIAAYYDKECSPNNIRVDFIEEKEKLYLGILFKGAV